MDFGTLLGALVGLVLIGFAMATGDGGLILFVNLPSALIVIGGTLAATAIAFPTKEVGSIIAVSMRVFRNPQVEVQGLLALEGMAKKTKHTPLKKGLGLIADGTDSGTLHEILTTELKQTQDHHKVGQRIFSEMGKFAPAFGMIGTLVALVQMLSNLDDPTKIGPNMAVALLTTLYGALLANLFLLPMVTKLERRAKIEAFEIQLIIIGLLAINKGDSTQILREKLDAYMAGHQTTTAGQRRAA